MHPSHTHSPSHTSVVPRWYTPPLPTRHPRIQVTEDPQLTWALRAAAPYLPQGLSRSAQVRALAIAGADHLIGVDRTYAERKVQLEALAATFDEPDKLIDMEALRDVKQLTQRVF